MVFVQVGDKLELMCMQSWLDHCLVTRDSSGVDGNDFPLPIKVRALNDCINFKELIQFAIAQG